MQPSQKLRSCRCICCSPMGTWGARLPQGHPAGHSGRDARRRWGLPSQGEGEAPPGPAQQQLGVVGQALPARFGAEEEPVSQPWPAQQLLELQRFPLQVPLPFPGEESRTQPLPLTLAEKTRQQVSPRGGIGHGGHGYQPWAQRASAAQGGPGSPGAQGGGYWSLLALVTLEVPAPGGGVTPVWSCCAWAVPASHPETPTRTPDAPPLPPPPHAVERRTMSPEHATVTPIPPAPGAAPGATPPSGRGDVTPQASWSPGGSRGGCWHATKPLPRPLAWPGTELCHQPAPRDAWVGGWTDGQPDECMDGWIGG